MTNTKKWGFAVLWIIVGGVYCAYSGRAEGFTGVRSFLIFFVIALFGAFAADITALLKALYRKEHAQAKALYPFIAIKLAAILLVIAGHRIDTYAIERTMKTGDALIAAMEAYKAQNGQYPVSLEAEYFTQYQPALKHSTFRIFHHSISEFSLSFNSVAFTTCIRKNTETQWACGD